nr:hypothetical protein CFP56_21083 [Quercus suber]
MTRTQITAVCFAFLLCPTVDPADNDMTHAEGHDILVNNGFADDKPRPDVYRRLCLPAANRAGIIFFHAVTLNGAQDPKQRSSMSVAMESFQIPRRSTISSPRTYVLCVLYALDANRPMSPHGGLATTFDERYASDENVLRFSKGAPGTTARGCEDKVPFPALAPSRGRGSDDCCRHRPRHYRDVQYLTDRIDARHAAFGLALIGGHTPMSQQALLAAA